METNTESNSELQNSDDIKEEVDSDDVEEILVGCDNISPKQCQKLQFSIAQIMGFEGKEGDRKVEFMKHEDRDDREESGTEQPVKLWRPLAQPPAASSAASVTSGGISPASPGYHQHHQHQALSPGFGESEHHHVPAPGPAALALLRHYTFFRCVTIVIHPSILLEFHVKTVFCIMKMYFGLKYSCQIQRNIFTKDIICFHEYWVRCGH